MGTEKRDRQKANRDAKRAAQEAAEARQRRNRLIRNALILAAVVLLVGLVVSLTSCTKDDASNDSAFQSVDAGDTTAGAQDQTSTTATTATTAAAPAAYGTGECPPAAGVSKPVIDFDAAPKQCIDPAKTYTATVVTTEGTVTLALDTDKTPITTNNFVVLARYGFYDGTDLFRTEAATGIIQGGSPHTQSNADEGPGYTIPDEALPFTADDYGPGTLAMARTSEANSGGGQFFLLANEGGRYLGDSAQLGPDAGTYVVFGHTTAGLDVLAKIAALDNGSGSGTPSKKVTISKVTITES